MVQTRTEGRFKRITIGRDALWTAERTPGPRRLIADIKGGNAASLPGADAPPVQPVSNTALASG